MPDTHHLSRIGASAFQEGTYLLCLKLASTGYPFDLYICQAQNRFQIICSHFGCSLPSQHELVSAATFPKKHDASCRAK